MKPLASWSLVGGALLVLAGLPACSPTATPSGSCAGCEQTQVYPNEASIDGKVAKADASGRYVLSMSQVLKIDATRVSNYATLVLGVASPTSVDLHGRVDGVDLTAAQLAAEQDWRPKGSPKVIETWWTTSSKQIPDVALSVSFGDVPGCVSHRYDKGCNSDP